MDDTQSHLSTMSEMKSQSAKIYGMERKKEYESLIILSAWYTKPETSYIWTSH